MATAIVFILALVLFCLSFTLTRILDSCRQLLAVGQQATATISDKALDDLSKEKLVQAASIDMLKKTVVLTAKLALTLGLTLAPMLAADMLGFVSFASSSEFALRLDVLLITTVLIAGYAALRRKSSHKS